MTAERLKQGLIATYEPAKAILLWSAAIVVLVIGALIVWYLPSLMKAWSHAGEAQARQAEQATITSDLSDATKRLTAKADIAVDNLVDASAAFKRTAVKAEFQIATTFGNLNAGLAEVTDLVADVRQSTLPAVNLNLTTLNENQIKIGKTIETTDAGLKDILSTLAASGENIRILTSSKDLQALPADLREFIESLNRTGHKVELIADDLHATGQNITGVTGNLNLISADAQRKSHELLYPPPSPWWKRYILGPLQQVGGVTYLILKIANGL